MFLFDRVSCPLTDTLSQNAYMRLSERDGPGNWDNEKFVLMNLGQQDIRIKFTAPGISVGDWPVEQNTAVVIHPDKSIETVIAPFNKVSTLKPMLGDVNLRTLVKDPSVLPEELWEYDSYTADVNNFNTVITFHNVDRQSGLIPYVFSDQDYQLDQIASIISEDGKVLSINGRTYSYFDIERSIHETVDGHTILVLYFYISLVDGRYEVFEGYNENGDGVIYLNQMNEVQISWCGDLESTVETDDYYASAMQSANVLVETTIQRITCADALDWSGAIATDINVPLTIEAYEYTATTNTEAEAIAALTTLGFEVTTLTKWLPVSTE